MINFIKLNFQSVWFTDCITSIPLVTDVEEEHASVVC